jgi:GTP-binding protein Era
MVLIDATILCEKDSHKGILIGKGGLMLKSIGTAARIQIEKMLDCRCYLELQVKVREDWQNRSGILRDLGLSNESGT